MVNVETGEIAKQTELTMEIIKRRGCKPMPTMDRLMSFVEKNISGCWIWMGARDVNGYGRVNYGGHAKSGLAHRVMYIATNGTISNNLPLDHLCRNTSCVNPGHLEPVTYRENALRGLTGKYQSARTHCKKGHPYDEKNTFWRKNKKGRACRKCVMLSVWKYRGKEITK